MPRQPYQHDLVVALRAPTQVWSQPDGQIRDEGIEGYYHGDRRIISRALVTIDGQDPILTGCETASAGEAVHHGFLARPAGPTTDPAVSIERRARVEPGVVTESITIAGSIAGDVLVRAELACDLASMDLVRTCVPGDPVFPEVFADHAEFARDHDTVRLRLPGAHVSVDGATVIAEWSISFGPGRPAQVGWQVDTDVMTIVEPAATGSFPAVTVGADDRRIEPIWNRSLSDLDALRMTIPGHPHDPFLAAGAPWFFTLFGRDSLWAARFCLPLGTDWATGTLRSLARLQGTTIDPASCEAPGKIPHELRDPEAAAVMESGDRLPPLYYGTIDATPLWICLLYDAWRWGMDPAVLTELTPNLLAALGWIADYSDADGDGFSEYIDERGTGLANQGWKDSSDSVQFRDGSLAVGPIALVEAQAYNFAALRAGASLIDALGLSGADRWRVQAQALAERFRESFWLADDLGPYLAIALDGNKRPVDTVTSNMGHVLGTGILTPEEESVIAARLADPGMDSGYGLRTMDAGSAGYWPLKYHGGSVWTHDTAIAISGLAAGGFAEPAAQLAAGVVRAAADFGGRIPELHSGVGIADSGVALPYPSACRPQAWSAASVVSILSSLLGIVPDVPAGTLTISPLKTQPFGRITIDNLQIAGYRLDLTVGPAGEVERCETDFPGAVVTP